MVSESERGYAGLGNAMRVAKNPPIFKPVNVGLCALKNPGLVGFG